MEKSSRPAHDSVAVSRRLRAVVAVAALAVGGLGACVGDPEPAATKSPNAAAAIPTPTDFHRGPASTARGDDLVTVETLVTRLDIPWGVTFLPDGSALVTERHKRRILRVGPGRGADGELTVRPVTTIEGVYANNEGGLLGIAASPHFRRDQTVFIYYTTKKDNRIAKLRLSDRRPRPVPIVTGIPQAGVHNGGRLAFGPDGYLYATTGDASRAGGAQDLNDLGGKILRMTMDGKPAPGNPFKGSLVWSYGHRNPEGIAWDANGTMYSAEIGEAVWDELNLILPGRNYGWPKVQGMGTGRGLTNPLVVWRPEIGVTNGIAIVGQTAIVTCLRGQRIYLVGLGGPVNIGSERIRDAVRAPDGSVWLTTSNRDGRNQPVPEDDRILRLTFRSPSPSSTTR